MTDKKQKTTSVEEVKESKISIRHIEGTLEEYIKKKHLIVFNPADFRSMFDPSNPLKKNNQEEDDK